jgi:hypothetical protein
MCIMGIMVYSYHVRHIYSCMTGVAQEQHTAYSTQHSLLYSLDPAVQSVCGPGANEKSDQSQEHLRAALFLAAITVCFQQWGKFSWYVLFWKLLFPSLDVSESLLTDPSQCAALL